MVRELSMPFPCHYLAYLHGVAEQSLEAGHFLVPGEILLQAAKGDILHDQLVSPATYKQDSNTNARKHKTKQTFLSAEIGLL